MNYLDERYYDSGRARRTIGNKSKMSGGGKLVDGSYIPLGSSASADNAVATSSEGGMTGADWAGIGLQVLGGMMQDSADKKYQKEMLEYERKREDELLKRQDLKDKRNREDVLKQNAEEKILSQRSQNQAGLGLLSGLVDKSNQMGRRMSFSEALINSGRAR